MQEQKLTGYPSIDKPWLKYYSEEAINAPLPECTIYEYLFIEHVDDICSLDKSAVYLYDSSSGRLNRVQDIMSFGLGRFVYYSHGMMHTISASKDAMMLSFVTQPAIIGVTVL